MIDKREDTAVVDLPTVEAPEAPRTDWLWWLPWSLAAALGLLSIFLVHFGSTLRNENDALGERLAETEFAFAELQSQQTNFQRRALRTETNYVNRISDLQKQVVQKNQELDRQRVVFESRGSDASEARKKVQMLQTQLAQSSAELDRLSEQLSGVNSPNQDRLNQLRVGLLLPTPDGPSTASGSLVYDLAEQKGILITDGLPPLTPDRDYQLWLIDQSLGGPVSGGIFRVNERGGIRLEYKPLTQLRSPERFGISIERKGGSPTPQGRFVLTSN